MVHILALNEDQPPFTKGKIERIELKNSTMPVGTVKTSKARTILGRSFS